MITIVTDNLHGDWVAIYKDDKLLAQGHSFYTTDVLDLLGIKYEEINGNTDETGNRFPMNLKEVVRREVR